MSSNEVIIHVGQIGVSLRAHCVDEDGNDIDVSAAGSLTMYVKALTSGTLKAFTASLVTTGLDGRIHYVTAAESDLDEDGWWEMQPYVISPTKRFRCLKYKFPVRSVLAAD